MGMAASQARYLALTARKTNVEYEGQQINQSRLVLSNQSANLFNQMLGMEVPTAPSVEDFSKLQYSYSDGINNSVIDNYYQLGTANADYNYVVTSYHYEDIYTGSRKLLTDPQIQATKTDKYSYDPTKDKKMLSVKAILSPTQTGNGTYIITDSNNLTHTFSLVDNTKTADRNKINAIDGKKLSADNFIYDLANDKYSYTSIEKTISNPAVAVTSFVALGTNYTYGGKTYSPIDLTTLTSVSQQYKNLLTVYGDTFEEDFENAQSGGLISNKYFATVTAGGITNYAKNVDGTNGATTADVYQVTNALSDYTKVDTTDTAQEAELINVYGSDYSKSDNYYVIDTGTGGNHIYNYIKSSEVKSGQSSFDHASQVVMENNSTKVYYTDGNGNYVLDTDLATTTIGSQLPSYTAQYTPTFSDYTAVGNSKLNYVTTDSYKKDSTISTEIEQIMKDMMGDKGSKSAAENFAKCFDVTGNYIGGIYSFEMAGVRYFTTEPDLQNSVSSAYTEDPIASNGIDGQQSKLAYYNATYLSTKVSETKNALLETDGNGRFSSIKFEDDSVVYSLNTETITDDAAYQDAMNKYYYKQQVYDKAIADINSKTEIIQAQDRELELRLEQLNTEQSALQNEMEAVKKIVDKHIEQGFKTFGG